MREVVLFIALSLDGYVADKQGGVAWLGGDGSDPENFGSYPAFYESIDTVVLGRSTYEQIVGELAPDAWPYAGKQSYVLTHRPLPDAPGIAFTDCAPEALIAQLKAQPGGDIWICGGARVAQQLIERDLIDRYHLSLIPTVLGDGVPLFSAAAQNRPLRLLSSTSYNGIVDVVYARRAE